MTSQEFVIWLKGFTEGVHEYNITPKQWEILKEKLGQVIGDDNKFIETPFTPITTPHTINTPMYPGTDPYNPYKITCTPGTTGHVSFVNQHLTTGTTDTIRTSGYSARTDAPVNTSVTYTTGSGIGYSTIRTVNSPDVIYSTGTAYSPQSGSWHYTTNSSSDWNIKHKDLLND